MSLSYDYHYVSTEDRLVFIQENSATDIVKAYQRLNDGAAQADLWRLLVLQHFGGIYLDIDAHLVFLLSGIINKTDRELFILKGNSNTPSVLT
jgi:mannosyltransferase OCH1-like enzyme